MRGAAARRGDSSRDGGEHSQSCSGVGGLLGEAHRWRASAERDLDEIIARIPQSLEISLTTNGILLAERAEALARAGLDRVNISLDSLQPGRYCGITGGRPEDLERVLAGVDAAIEADLLPIKLNFVLLKNNEPEVPDMIEFCRQRGLILQLIELLDLQGQGISGDIEGIERSLAARADAI